MPSFEEILDRFIDECRNGQSPSISDYQKKFPEMADQIGDVFPTALLLEKGPDGKHSSIEPTLAKGGESPSRPWKTTERIQHYQIVREIGRGGMGIVYEARDEILKRTVALKVLYYSGPRNREAVLRFLREATVAARLQHENIVPVYATSFSDGKFFYAMQMIQGIGIDAFLRRFQIRSERAKTLLAPDLDWKAPFNVDQIVADDSLDEETKEFIFKPFLEGDYAAGVPYGFKTKEASPPSSRRRNSFDADFFPGRSRSIGKSFRPYGESVARVGIQIARGLDYAHSQQVIHRDIKPSNILLDKQGKVWITDFGLARPLSESDLTESGQLIGTLRYLAPESLRGVFTKQGDIYSLGLTLYEMVTFRPAFDDDQYGSLIAAVDAGKIVPPRKIDRYIPRDLETIILKATHRRPELRYHSAGEMAEDLRLFLLERPIRAKRTPLVERLWLWGRRNPLAVLMTGLLVMTAILVSFGSVIGFLRERSLVLDNIREANRVKTDLNLALSTFDDIFSVCGDPIQIFTKQHETTLFLSPPNEPIREKEKIILSTLLLFYERLVGENVDERFTLERARAYSDIGKIQQRLGRSDAAFDAMKKSLACYRREMETAGEPDALKSEMAEMVSWLLPRLPESYRDPLFFKTTLNDAVESVDEMKSGTQDELLATLLYYRAVAGMNLTEPRDEDANPLVLHFSLERPTVAPSLPDEDEIAEIENDFNECRTRLQKRLKADPDSLPLAAQNILVNGTYALWLSKIGKRDESDDRRNQSVESILEMVEKNPKNDKLKHYAVKILLLNVYTLLSAADQEMSSIAATLVQIKEIVDQLAARNPDEEEYRKFSEWIESEIPLFLQ